MYIPNRNSIIFESVLTFQTVRLIYTEEGREQALRTSSNLPAKETVLTPARQREL